MNAKQLSFFEYILTSEFEVHRESLALVDEGMRESLFSKMETLEDAARSAESEEDFGLFISMSFEYDPKEEGEKFMAVAFNSFFATSFALFESKIKHICDLAQRSAKCPISLETLSTRNNIGNAKKYLEALGIDFPSGGDEWKEITAYREIRNIIMHSGASIPESNENLLKYAHEKQITSNWSRRELTLTRYFCEEALDNLEKFVVMIYRAHNELQRQRSEESG